MNIHDIVDRIKPQLAKVSQKEPLSNVEIVSYEDESSKGKHSIWEHLFLATTIILLAILSFGLGRLSVSGRAGVSIEYDPSLGSAMKEVSGGAQAIQAASTSSTEVVASNRGSKYYFEYCSNTISEKNKIKFTTPSLAEAAGYTLAANCKAR
jgi:hypothetical protein